MTPPRYAVVVDVVVTAPFADGPRVLLIRRAHPPHGWAIPGGFVEPDEDLTEAARRELREETGVTAAELTLFDVYGRPDRDPRGRTISVVYRCELSTAPAVQAGDDAAAARWFPIGNLPTDLAFDHGEILCGALTGPARR